MEPANIFEKSNAAFKKGLEESPEMWDKWTKSDKRYALVCRLLVVENNMDNVVSGKVTGHFDCRIGSNSLEDLKMFWDSKFVSRNRDNTMQHFIVDAKENKVVECLSVCV